MSRRKRYAPRPATSLCCGSHAHTVTMPPHPDTSRATWQVHLHPELFTVESGLITPTFKLKRPQARAYFKAAIDEMYAALAASGAL